MSLLPGQVPSQSDPIGRVNSDGTVTVEKNWWLLIYNLVLNVLGTGEGLPASALIELANISNTVTDTDAISLRQPISNLQMLRGFPADVPIKPAAVFPALLPDPVPQAQPSSIVAVGASPFTFTAPFNGTAVITGGTVSQIQLLRQAATVATGVTSGIFPLSRLDQLVITHTGAPTMTFLPT